MNIARGMGGMSTMNVRRCRLDSELCAGSSDGADFRRGGARDSERLYERVARGRVIRNGSVNDY